MSSDKLRPIHHLYCLATSISTTVVRMLRDLKMFEKMLNVKCCHAETLLLMETCKLFDNCHVTSKIIGNQVYWKQLQGCQVEILNS